MKKAIANTPNRHKLLIQFLEYMAGGGVYFWSGLLVFFICYNLLHWHWLIGKGLADLIGWTLNYLVQRYWAFYDKRLQGQDKRVVFRFVLINAIDLIFDYLIVASVVHAGYTPYIGFVLSAAFTTVWDYVWYRFWVFKVAPEKSKS